MDMDHIFDAKLRFFGCHKYKQAQIFDCKFFETVHISIIQSPKVR